MNATRKMCGDMTAIDLYRQSRLHRRHGTVTCFWHAARQGALANMALRWADDVSFFVFLGLALLEIFRVFPSPLEGGG